jgi:hypothetical protein
MRGEWATAQLATGGAAEVDGPGGAQAALVVAGEASRAGAAQTIDARSQRVAQASTGAEAVPRRRMRVVRATESTRAAPATARARTPR